VSAVGFALHVCPVFFDVLCFLCFFFLASNTRTMMGKEKNAEESSNGEMNDAGAKLKKKNT
jgi:hypothetical protein